MKKIFFISAVSGVGKSTTCDYIRDNKLLENYVIFDIDELENINEYNNDTYNLFYRNAVTKAIKKSNDKNIIIGSCINPNDINSLNLSEEVNINMILITCSNEELTKRLKARDESRNCSSDEFIKAQVDYQNYMINHLDMYDLHIDNTNSSIEIVSSQIVDFIKNKEVKYMNKVLLVNGSNRDAYSYKILKEIEKDVFDAKLIKLNDYNIEFCKGCLYCDKNAKCVINDDLNKIVDEMLNHDIIVFAIPNYFGGMSGFFKNFMDRLHFMYKRSVLKDKKIVFIYTGALEDDSITMEEMTRSTHNVEKYLELSVVKRYSFSSRKELDINKIKEIKDFLNK